MKKKLARLFFKWARKLDPQKVYEMEELYEPVKLGIGYHITKNDVRRFRKENEQYTSHRKGLDGLIEDTKNVILGNIAAGLVEKGCLKFKIKKSLWTAEVSAHVVVYKEKEC